MNFSFLEGDMNIGSHSQYFITPASSGGGSSAANSGTAVGGGGVGNNIPGDMTWIQK